MHLIKTSKNDQQRIIPWLDNLQVLLPPGGVILVGAGSGTGEWVNYLLGCDISNVTLVEADDIQFQHLKRAVPKRDDWHLSKQVVAPDAESVTFYQASNSAESGLLDPESLLKLWPNIKTRKQQSRDPVALATLLQKVQSPINWLIIDCLPALSIIQSASERLDEIDLVVIRVLRDESVLPSKVESTADLQSYLSGHGFRFLADESSRHPVIGYALYVRDAQAAIKGLREKLAQVEKEKQLEIQKQSQTTAQQAENYKDQLKELLQAKQAAEEKLEESLQQIKHLEVKIENTSRARDEQAHISAERQKQIDMLTKLQADTETKLEQEKVVLAKKLLETQNAMREKEDAYVKLSHRNQLMREELDSAEAQIDLIKEHLLREPDR